MRLEAGGADQCGPLPPMWARGAAVHVEDSDVRDLVAENLGEL
jgi:hypothetical protein